MDKYVPKYVPEGINNPKENFGREFLKFVVGTFVVVGVFFFTLNLAVDFLADSMSAQTDRKLRNYFRGAESGLFVGKKSVESAYLNNLIQKMDEPLQKNLAVHVRVVCDPKVNVLATFGGEILVLDGFLQNIQTENELVMVLGHELGHFAKRHHWRSLGNSAIYMFIHMGLSMAGIDSLVGASPGIIFGKFSQKHELEADEYGLNLLNQQFGHVGGYDLFFNKLLTIDLDEHGRKHPGEIESWFSTHPYPTDRNATLKEFSQSKGFTESAVLQLPPELKTLCKSAS